MWQDILEAPKLAQELVRRVTEIQNSGKIPSGDWRRIIFTARGSSENACRVAVAQFTLSSQVSAGLHAPSELAHGTLPDDMSDTLVFAVSQSGVTPEVCTAAQRVSDRGAFVVGVTNSDSSPLAQIVTFHVALNAGAERVIAATKTVVGQTIVLLMLTYPIARPVERAVDWMQIPAILTESMRDSPAFPTKSVVSIVESADSSSIANEAALKIMETSGVPIFGGSTNDFLHGPVAILNSENAVVTFAPNKINEESHKMLENASFARCAELVTLGLTPGPGYPLALFGQLIHVQRLAIHEALRRNLNPDDSRGLSKVTETV